MYEESKQIVRMLSKIANELHELNRRLDYILNRASGSSRDDITEFMKEYFCSQEKQSL